MLMMRRGRKFGFRSGSAMGMVGASLAAIGLGMGSFAVMCVGGLFLGYAIANMQLYRFAAVELAPGHFRAQAISYVTAGGVLAGIIGPGLARLTPDLWLPTFQATLCAIIGVHAIAFVVLGFIEFPPVKAEDSTGPQRPLLEIVTQPAYMVACAGAIIAFGVMSFVMAASPLAIVMCGLSKTEAPVTIFVHTMGMFVPAFFTGHLIARHGVFKMMMAGIALLVASVAVALMGVTEWHFRIALCLNGVGWNFLFVGATTLLTTTYRPAERGKAQAFNDFMVFGTTTTASLMASVVLGAQGLGCHQLRGAGPGLRGVPGDRPVPPAPSGARLSWHIVPVVTHCDRSACWRCRARHRCYEASTRGAENRVLCLTIRVPLSWMARCCRRWLTMERRANPGQFAP